jgi:hypothetical protein
MKCENAQQNIILAQYGELPDELQFPLEQHLGTCEDCRREWNALLALNEELALTPMIEPSPNLLAGRKFYCEISSGPRSAIAAAGDSVEPGKWSDCERFWYCADA